MKTVFAIIGGAALVAILTSCAAGEGDRCNPSQYSDNGSQGDCDTGYACVYPTAPVCGVAYCCKVDSSGNVTDPNPNCQADPALSCAPDLSQPPVVDLSMAD